VNVDGIDEPDFNFDMATGERDIILPGNKTLSNGDKVRQPPEDPEEGSSGSEDGDGLDEFAFTLTKEEFLNLYFSEMCLPNFIKESLKDNTKMKWKRSGWTKDGVPARIDLVKTLKQSLARRIATHSERFLDDIDLRYRHFTKQPFPIKQAVMICLMDVSGSMGEFEKEMAKKFYLLLYLFLNKMYKHVELVFIAHTQEANEVTEEEFFYGKQTGGTIVSSGLQLAKEIIDSRFNSGYNVYIAQVSDGDNWDGDDDVASDLVEELLERVQYFAYVQTETKARVARKKKYNIGDLMTTYEELAEKHKHLQARQVTELSEVYSVLRSLFED
jgi:uncharacterized protein